MKARTPVSLSSQSDRKRVAPNHPVFLFVPYQDTPTRRR
jgi:hypothetical protein